MAEEPQFVALRTMKVQTLDATGKSVPDPERPNRPTIRTVQPGDPVPEARFWRKQDRELKLGRIAPVGSPQAAIVMRGRGAAAPAAAPPPPPPARPVARGAVPSDTAPASPPPAAENEVAGSPSEDEPAPPAEPESSAGGRKASAGRKR